MAVIRRGGPIRIFVRRGVDVRFPRTGVGRELVATYDVSAETVVEFQNHFRGNVYTVRWERGWVGWRAKEGFG